MDDRTAIASAILICLAVVIAIGVLAYSANSYIRIRRRRADIAAPLTRRPL
ncbi:hypothetical protein [Castellaniella sp.]|uniref:hypothetical protein n=1 Tax=Castellaniella sp. TaxID=1955812 RepID=UPI002AFE3B45|nr:hypothetical protein [Castellaniella sp.]